MALYLGSKKVAGNTTSESLDDDVKDYKVTFDDSGEVEGITNIDTFMSNFKSKLTLSNLFSMIKAGFKIVKDNIANLTTSNIKSTDTEGLLGSKNAQVISQDLIDKIANKVVNELVTNQNLTNTLANYVSKSMISTSIENNSSKVAATSLVNQLNNDKVGKNSPTINDSQLNWNLSDNDNIQLRKSGDNNSYEFSLVYTDSDGNKEFNKIIDINKEFIPSKAPKVHTSTSASTYGSGDNNNYGHVKLSDNWTNPAGDASNGVGASSQAVYNVYNYVNTNKMTVAHGTTNSSQRAINISFTSTNGTIGLILMSAPIIIFMTADLTRFTSSLNSDVIAYYCPYHGTATISSIAGILGDGDNRYRIKILWGEGQYLGAFDIAFLVGNIRDISIAGATG